jgi:hypothetical protein
MAAHFPQFGCAHDLRGLVLARIGATGHQRQILPYSLFIRHNYRVRISDPIPRLALFAFAQLRARVSRLADQSAEDRVAQPARAGSLHEFEFAPPLRLEPDAFVHFLGCEAVAGAVRLGQIYERALRRHQRL